MSGLGWSRRVIAHSQRLPAQYAHRTTRVRKSMESSMTGATTFPCNTPRNAKMDGNPIARLASNEKAPVLSGKQNQEQNYVHSIPEHTNYEDPDISEADPDDAYFDLALNDHEHLYFDPVSNNYEPTRNDCFSIEPWEKDRLKRLAPHYLSSYLTTVASTEEFPPRSPSVLPKPTSGKRLYHNLIHILRTNTSSRPTLAALLDYHLLFPDHHSVESYNLLISLSIHHRAYGVTRKLFRTMEDRSIQYDAESHRLYVRWFIFKGFWDKAWSYAMQLKNKFQGGRIPFPIWLEFCHARSKGPIIGGTFNPKTKKNSYWEPVSLMSARSDVLNINRPPEIPALKDTPPAAIRNIVKLMVRSRLKHQALKLTESYFRALPLKMDSGVNRRCLDIVKIHLAFNVKGRTSLTRFRAARSLFFSLLSLNQSLRPTPDILMYILSPLKRVRPCGTIAWKFISLCKEKWGLEVEDRQVRRRVANLALKEGRMDIVETLSRVEATDYSARQSHLTELEVVGDFARLRDRFLDRPSVQRIYPHNGRENYLWHRLRLRIRRTKKKRKAQGLLFTIRKAQDRRFTIRKAQGRQLTGQARSPVLTRKPAKSIS